MTAVAEPTTTTATLEEAWVRGKGVLTGMLSDLALSTSTDPTDADCLRVVRLHTHGGELHGWSTNRFVAAHAKVDMVAGDNGLSAPILAYATDVKRVHSAFRNSTPLVGVKVDRAAGIATFTDYETSVTVRLVDVEFPALTNAVKGDVPESGEPVRFDPKWLDVVCKVAKRRKADLIIATQPVGPTHVQIGDDYRAWIMPYRIDGGVNWLPSEF